METSELKKTLLEAAICTMACDGEIHEHEIAEIEKISETTSYFHDFDCKMELKKIIDEAIPEYFSNKCTPTAVKVEIDKNKKKLINCNLTLGA